MLTRLFRGDRTDGDGAAVDEPTLRWVADKAESAPIEEAPFPHVAIYDFLPPEAFARLTKAMPKPAGFKAAKNTRKLDLDVVESSAEFGRLSERDQQQWRGARDAVIRETVAPILARRFEPWLREKYEWLLGAELAAEFVDRGLTSTNGRVMGRRPGYKLDPHLDSAHFGVTCLLYFTSAADADSGALCLYRPTRELEVKHVSTYYPDKEEGVDVELAKTIPVRENLFVAFVNGPASLHGFGVEQEAAEAEYLRFVYQSHVVLRDFRRDEVYERLPEPQRARWAELVERGAM
jgi:hypothetical protein